MNDTPTPPARPAAPAEAPLPGRAPAARPVPPGSRLESARMVVALLTDLASTPWHLAVFLFTRGRARRELRAALAAEVPAS